MRKISLLITVFGVIGLLANEATTPEDFECIYHTYNQAQHEFCFNKSRSVFIYRTLTDAVGFIVTTPSQEITP